MKLIEILTKNKPLIIKKWFNATTDTYPSEGAKFFKEKDKKFSNPVGHTISIGIEGIFNGLIDASKADEIDSSLEDIIRIRAVQEFTPSEAVGFMFILKRIIREETSNIITDGKLFHELLEFESKIDDAALKAFDIYMKMREKIFELKANEVRNRTSKIIDRLNKKSDFFTND